MTKEEILRKAIEKAVKNGWDIERWFSFHNGNIFTAGTTDAFIEHAITRLDLERDEHTGLIFSHDFAKAFWKDEPHWWFGWHVGFDHDNGYRWWRSDDKNTNYGDRISPGSNPVMCKDAWEYHLQQLALAENRLEYLAKFL